MADARLVDIGNDGVWDVWQLESPNMVWYFRCAAACAFLGKHSSLRSRFPLNVRGGVLTATGALPDSCLPEAASHIHRLDQPLCRLFDPTRRFHSAIPF
jgi:hypothetical protein